MKLWVADASAPVWAAVGQIMATTPYLFAETAGGTYNCRNIGGTNTKSIHAYALALDLNPSKNPHKAPLTHNYPPDVHHPDGRDQSLRGPGPVVGGPVGQTADAMHWQINVAPEECETVTWDKGDDMAKGPNGEPNWDKVSGLGERGVDSRLSEGGHLPTLPTLRMSSKWNSSWSRSNGPKSSNPLKPRAAPRGALRCR